LVAFSFGKPVPTFPENALTTLILARRKWRGAIMLAALGWSISLVRADMIVTAGMQPWETCAACHSLDGISAMARFPKLAGQRPDYIEKQVRDFRDGRRRNDGGQMAAIAGDINDHDLAKSAAYFASLPAPPPDASLPTDTEDWRRGAALYREGDATVGISKCSSCHDDANSARIVAPILRAQHAAYLAKQLRDWRSGERRNDSTQTMPAIAARLSDQDISALAAFLAAQPRLQPNGGRAQ
jgi:cytochrome c553